MHRRQLRINLQYLVIKNSLRGIENDCRSDAKWNRFYLKIQFIGLMGAGNCY